MRINGDAELEAIDDERINGGHAEIVATAEADVDGKGKPSLVGLMHFESGRGCGRLDEYLAHIVPSGASTAPTRLSGALGNQVWGPVHLWDRQEEFADTNKIVNKRGHLTLFSYDGRTYILGHHDGTTGVFRIDGDHVVQACTVDVMPQIEIDRSYIPR